MSSRTVRAFWLGRRKYEPVHQVQLRLFEARQQGRIGDTLLLLEHEPVITLGRGAKREHVLAGETTLRARGIDVCETARGGDVTYHGPGQLVGYPIVNLAPDRCDVRRWVGDLLKTMIALAAGVGVGAGVIAEYPGVWVDLAQPSTWPGEAAAREAAKLGAVGVRISKWVTMHGFALNATTAMDAFALIVPCGIRDHGVTSLAQLRGSAPSPQELAPEAARVFCEVFGARLDAFERLDSADDGWMDRVMGPGPAPDPSVR